MTITFCGGAQSVTGSKHLVTLDDGPRVLLDCGMFQGQEANHYDQHDNFLRGIDPATIDYLMLSHAHVDHSGLVPLLVKSGFTGPIFCTPPTRELCELVLNDSAHLQQYEADPLYTAADVERCWNQFVTVPYGQAHRVSEAVEVLFTDAGHVLGSAAVNLTLRENQRTRTLCFSGDVGRYSNRILNAPQACPPAEVVICELTYGDHFHASLENTEERLRRIIQDTCVERQGKLLIPAFSIGRTQELILSLAYLAEHDRLPPVNIFVDSPMSVYATDIIRNHTECFNPDLSDYLGAEGDPFTFPQLHYITEVEDSKLLHAVDEPCVIISSSGMMQGGRIVHHLHHNIGDARNTVLITGYCEPSTLGGRLMQGAQRVGIRGEEHAVEAEIIQMKEYSAHADYGDFLRFLFPQQSDVLRQLFLVHGETSRMESFKTSLEADGYRNVTVAAPRISYEV